MSKYDFREAVWVTRKEAAMLADLTLKEFNELYKSDGYFRQSFTSEDLIEKASIDMYLRGELARPEASKEMLEGWARAAAQKAEKQRKRRAAEDLNSAIVRAYQAKKRIQDLKRLS